MKKIKLNECKTFLMPEEWYFDNFNTHPLCGHCIVGNGNDLFSPRGKRQIIGSKKRITLLNNDDLFVLKLTCGNNLYPVSKKQMIWYYVPHWYEGSSGIVEYACGSFRKLHYTQHKNKSLKSHRTIFSVKIGDWSSSYELYKCNYTLDEYMKKFPNDVRGEHFNDHGKLERIKEIVHDDVGADEYQPDRANTITMFYHSVKNWNILQSKLEAEADWEYDE